jgi:hypothetical protein
MVEKAELPVLAQSCEIIRCFDGNVAKLTDLLAESIVAELKVGGDLRGRAK